MSLRTETIFRLLNERGSRESYIRAKLNQLIPSQIKALRLQHKWTQKQLGDESDMKQARISAMEKPGEVSFSIETLIRLAAAYGVALRVDFVPFSEILKWDNGYSQDDFTVLPIDRDEEFLSPSPMHYPLKITADVPIGNVFPETFGLASGTSSYVSIGALAPKRELGIGAAGMVIEPERRLTA